MCSFAQHFMTNILVIWQYFRPFFNQRDMLGRQEVEADTLASLQMYENGGLPVPKVLVSFPFPEIFLNNTDN